MGPSFLWKCEDSWPKQEVAEQLSVDDPEVKGTSLATTVSVSDATVRVDEVIERFSLWHTLKKFVAWILTFKSNLRKPRSGENKELEKRSKGLPIQPLSVTEMREAERALIQYVQRKHYAQEIENLKELNKNFSDGYLRQVKVKTKTIVLERPIGKCVLFEAAEERVY
ncbi:uncharacterized protein [Montipora foliosa]|uniref:uncharacterized protein n=1 Tax=Montipora foliosa TaxID=591990 RepID=UPI0035F1F006